MAARQLPRGGHGRFCEWELPAARRRKDERGVGCVSILPGSSIGQSSDRWKQIDGNHEAGRGRSEGSGVATGGTGM